MKEFTIEELAEWISDCFDYQLKPGEITAEVYAEEAGLDDKQASYRLNKLVKSGIMASKREVINGRNRRVFYRIPDVEFKAID